MEELGTKVYIYGLMDDKNNVFYIGKSIVPKSRFYDHSSSLNYPYLKMEILDVFYDKEAYWIKKYLKEGHPIKNKEVLLTSERWEIGQTFEFFKKQPQKVKYNGVIYSSINNLRTTTLNHLSEYHIRQIISNPKHHLAEQYKITLI